MGGDYSVAQVAIGTPDTPVTTTDISVFFITGTHFGGGRVVGEVVSGGRVVVEVDGWRRVEGGIVVGFVRRGRLRRVGVGGGRRRKRTEGTHGTVVAVLEYSCSLVWPWPWSGSYVWLMSGSFGITHQYLCMITVHITFHST